MPRNVCDSNHLIDDSCSVNQHLLNGIISSCESGFIYLVTIRKTKNPNDICPNDLKTTLNHLTNYLTKDYFESFHYCYQHEIKNDLKSFHLHAIIFAHNKISYTQIKKQFVGTHIHMQKLFALKDFIQAHNYMHKQNQSEVFNKYWELYFNMNHFESLNDNQQNLA